MGHFNGLIESWLKWEAQTQNQHLYPNHSNDESYIMIMSHDNPKIQINYIDVAKPVIIALVPV